MQPEGKLDPGNHLILTSKHTARTIEQKAGKVMGRLKCGVKFTSRQPAVLTILCWHHINKAVNHLALMLLIKTM